MNSRITPHERLVARCTLRQSYVQHTHIFVVSCPRCQEIRYLRYWGHTYYVTPYRYHIAKCHTCGVTVAARQEVI